MMYFFWCNKKVYLSSNFEKIKNLRNKRINQRFYKVRPHLIEKIKKVDFNDKKLRGYATCPEHIWADHQIRYI